LKFRELFRVFWPILLFGACAKKAPPKPIHTEPWLAHPPASAHAHGDGDDAAVATTKYLLTEQSRIVLELESRRARVRGKLTRVTGELELALTALAQSRAQVRADLSSLTIDGETDDAADWLSRARAALGLADGGATNANTSASFELTGLSDLSTEAIALTPADASMRPSARVRGMAEGNLLLNGFRVEKRVPLEAEFGLTSGGAEPSTLAIRSRAPLVLTLETHEIHLRDAPVHANAEKRRTRAHPSSHDIRVTFELYATKP